MAKGARRDRRLEAEWRRIIRGYIRSGLSIREFCTKSELPESAGCHGQPRRWAGHASTDMVAAIWECLRMARPGQRSGHGTRRRVLADRAGLLPPLKHR